MSQPQEPHREAHDAYWHQPEGQRAELIDGVLYAMTPPSRQHQSLVRSLFRAFDAYVAHNGGPCEVFFAPFSVGLEADGQTWLEPDVVVICDPSKLTDRGCEGAPDLVVEVVSPSNARMDYITKLAVYERAGVREYWIVDPATCETTVYSFEGERLRLAIYAFEDPVPVGIYNGDLEITVGRGL